MTAPYFGTFQYFSFITLNTVGYGDIVPVDNVGRTLSIFEALIGQIFLVVVVARVVALLGPGPAREGRRTRGATAGPALTSPGDGALLPAMPSPDTTVVTVSFPAPPCPRSRVARPGATVR